MRRHACGDIASAREDEPPAKFLNFLIAKIRRFRLVTCTDDIQTFKINAETANHAASDDATRATKLCASRPVLTRGKRRLVEISVCFSSLDTPLQ